MIVTCPQCSQQFKVPIDALGESGRKVRCHACQHVWHQEPAPEKEIHKEIDIDLQEQDLSRLVHGPSDQKLKRKPKTPKAPRQKKERGPLIPHKCRFSWFIVLGMLLVTGVFMERYRLAEFSPALKQTFQSLGLVTTRQHPVTFEKMRFTKIAAGHLIVFQMVNRTQSSVGVKYLTVSAVGPCETWHERLLSPAKHCVLKSWRTTKVEGIMKPGQKISVTLGPFQLPGKSTDIQLQLQ